MLDLKKVYKSITPPLLDNYLRLVVKQLSKKGGYFSGPYLNWEQAKQSATGYDAQNIIDTVRQAALKQKQNNSFVRDSVKLEKPDHSYPLLTALLSLLLNKSNINIIDFGGGLGSTYYNCKKFITDQKFSLTWNIVEQPNFVKIGQQDHQTDSLLFFDNIDAVNNHVDMIIFSGVLQYLPSFLELINKIKEKKYPYIFIDRLATHFQAKQPTTIMVEHVPAYIYKASYPCRIFNYDEVLNMFTDHYDVVYEFIANDGHLNMGNINILFKGVLLKLK